VNGARSRDPHQRETEKFPPIYMAIRAKLPI